MTVLDEREMRAEIRAVEADHLCPCETCQRSSNICPASAGTLIQELAAARIALRRREESG